MPKAAPNPNSLPDPTGILATLRTRDSRETFSRTALALSTETEMAPLLDLLLRCRTMHEVKFLALTLGLRVAAEGGQVVLSERKGKVVARAWLFD
jgi:hypothetical protein